MFLLQQSTRLHLRQYFTIFSMFWHVRRHVKKFAYEYSLLNTFFIFSLILSFAWRANFISQSPYCVLWSSTLCLALFFFFKSVHHFLRYLYVPSYFLHLCKQEVVTNKKTGVQHKKEWRTTKKRNEWNTL